MRITDKEVQIFLNKKLANRESFYIEGVAGSGKSSVLKLLPDHGYKKAIVIVPTNQLRLRHEERFIKDNLAIEIEAKTMASITSSVNRKSTEYDALDKELIFMEDIILIDEIYTHEPRQIQRIRDYASNNSVPCVLLGDRTQDTVQDTTHEHIDIEGITLDRSMRGTENTRQMTDILYRVAHTEKFLSPQALAELVVGLGGNVVYNFPTDGDNAYYGYTANQTQEELILRNNFKEKIFTGKVQYKKDEEYSKQWELAPIVSQTQRQAIQAICGIETPYATPRHTFNSKTCIGIEIDEYDNYYIILDTSKMVSTKSAYTLFSRHVDVRRITVCLIDPKQFVAPRQFGKRRTLGKEDIKVIEPIPYISTTNDKLNIINLNQAKGQLKLLIDYKSFSELLTLSEQPYTANTTRIYTESYCLEKSPEGQPSVIQAYMELNSVLDDKEATVKVVEVITSEGTKVYEDVVIPVKGQPEPKQASITEKTTVLLAELMRTAPGLVCDPAPLQSINGEFIKISEMQIPMYVQWDNEAVVDDLEPVNLLSDILDIDNTETFTTDTTGYKIDMKYSYYQAITNYSHLIGYGPMTDYNPDFKVHYCLAAYNGEVYNLNSKLIEEYKKVGIIFDHIEPYASRPNTLDEFITDEAREELLFGRHIRFTKAQTNPGWGKLSKPRYTVNKLIEGDKSQEVIQDEGMRSALYTLLKDLRGIQALIISLLAKTTTTGYIKYQADAVQSEQKLTLTEWIYDLPKPDITHEYHKGDNITLLDVWDTHHKRHLQSKADSLTADRVPSKYTEKAKKILNYLE